MYSGDLAPPGPTVPGIARRVLSMLYESLGVFAIVFFAGCAFYGATQSRLSGNTRLAFQLYLFLVLGAYFIACWSRGGRTLPMQTWKIRVVRRDNLPVGVGRAALRYVLAWPSLLMFGVGFFRRSSIASDSFCMTAWPGLASSQPAMEELGISNARRLLPAYLLSTHHIISVAAPRKTTLGSAALTKGCQFCSNPRCENRLFII